MDKWIFAFRISNPEHLKSGKWSLYLRIEADNFEQKIMRAPKSAVTKPCVHNQIPTEIGQLDRDRTLPPNTSEHSLQAEHEEERAILG